MSVTEYIESIGYDGVIVFNDYGIETLIGVDSETEQYMTMIRW